MPGMSSGPFRNRPSRSPLPEAWRNALKAGFGLGFIVFGTVVAVIRNIEYVPGDVRGTDAYHWIWGGVFVAAGIWLLLSIHYPRLRGPRR